MTVKDNKLIIGSIGKEWITPTGVSPRSKIEKYHRQLVNADVILGKYSQQC